MHHDQMLRAALEKKLGLHSLHNEQFLMILEQGKAEYLCKLLPYIWPVTDLNNYGRKI